MNSRHGCRFLITPVLILYFLSATMYFPARAQIVKKRETEFDKLVMTKRELRVSQTLSYADHTKTSLGYRDSLNAFRSQYGSGWRFLIDERIGRPNLVEGGALPFIPGSANKLRWRDFAAECDRPSCIPRSKMESLARNFLTHNQAALQINPQELVLDPVGTIPISNSTYFMRFQWVYGGVPVEGASVYLAINNGNLIQVGITKIGDIKLDPKPTIPLERAWEVLRAYVHDAADKDQIVNQGSLSIIPITPPQYEPDTLEPSFGKMIGYVLAYKLAFRRPGAPGTWEALVDAHTGELLRFRDSNDYGHIQGGVYKTDKPQAEVTEAFPKSDYAAGNYADTSGNFPGVSGTSTMTGLNTGSLGVSGGVKMTDNCGAISLTGNSIGLVDFGNGSGAGTDCTTTGVGGAGNTHSSRTQEWNVTEIKMKGITYLPSNTWLQGQLTDVVNINSTCNAFWDGTQLNFYKSGGGCNNTGELPGVSLHEWGHGMDANDGSGSGTDNVPIESRADWTAILQTHQSCTGSGFFSSGNCSGYGDACTACSGIRDADWAQHTHATPWTPQNNGQTDPGYSCSPGGYDGPCGWEDHCESGIPTQALWDFVNRDLVGAPTNLDSVTAWQLEDRLFYTGMPQATNMYTCTGSTTKVSDGCGAGSLYTVMRAIDDDGDGTANGTPHAAAIYAALGRHGIACGAATDTTNQNQTSCPSLTTPTLSATGNNFQTSLNWTSAGVNATRYFVLRNETSCTAGFTRIATVAAPTLDDTDNGVVHGATYFYRTQAATANDSCVSTMSNCATVTTQLPGDQDFYVRDWTDTPSSHDNGEEPSTNYSYNWAYTSDVWNRGTNSPGSPNSNDWYPTDNMFAGAGTLGDNYGFARVSRNSTGSTATVTAQFLISPFGAGSNFSPIASTTLSFASGDQSQVADAYWHQDATSSTHACIAVEISSPNDPFQSPDLSGHSPGDPDGQSLIILDNNKAQRNLGVSLNVAHFKALHCALIHNPGLLAQDMTLRYDSPSRDQLQGAAIQVVGGRTEEFRPGGTIVLDKMQPGENRPICFQYQLPSSEAVPVHFLQVDNGNPVNAFTILAQPVAVDVLIHDNLVNQVQVFNRLGEAFGITGGKVEANAAEKLAREKDVPPAQYLAFLKERLNGMKAVIEPLVRKEGPKGEAADEFGIMVTLKGLAAAVNSNQIEQSVSEHSILLRQLDSLATVLQKANGDPADFLQMVRWQLKLYSEVTELKDLKAARFVREESQEFIDSYGKHKRGADTYPELLHDLLRSFHETAEALEKNHVELEHQVAEIEKHGHSMGALEKVHRDYLMQLQALAK
jgi:hypothetical protein